MDPLCPLIKGLTSLNRITDTDTVLLLLQVVRILTLREYIGCPYTYLANLHSYYANMGQA